LLSLNGSELLEAMPPDWSTDGWGFNIFAPDYQYAPLLLVDGPGPGSVLPQSYLSVYALGGVPNDIPTIVGVTRQESDFSPGDDVRNFSAAEFALYVRQRVEPYYGSVFASELLQIYMPHGFVPDPLFAPQRIFSEIITDSTTLCPNFYLASRMQKAFSSPVYAYASSQRPQQPFCPLRSFNSFDYCPAYSFHASDEFLWLLPRFANYSWSESDHSFSRLLSNRVASFIANGTVPPWSTFTTPPHDASLHSDSLPAQYTAVDLAAPDSNIPALKKAACKFWLRNGFYETRGLIN
jgi:hypothetical protein